MTYTSNKSYGSNANNGHRLVDLGMTWETLWATCNVGETSPEQAGLYFAWGETVGATAEPVENGERSFGELSYKSRPTASISTDLELEEDAAHVNLGGNWRMPTKDEWQELIDNCNVVWTKNYNRTGVAGRVFTSKINGNSVFFPAAGYCRNSSVRLVGSYGYCWSASWYSSSSAWALSFHSGSQDLYYYGRYYGYSVRGVCKRG